MHIPYPACTWESSKSGQNYSWAVSTTSKSLKPRMLNLWVPKFTCVFWWIMWRDYKKYIDNQWSQDLSAPDAKITLKQFNNPRSTLENGHFRLTSLLTLFAWLNKELGLIHFIIYSFLIFLKRKVPKTLYRNVWIHSIAIFLSKFNFRVINLFCFIPLLKYVHSFLFLK